MNSAQTALSHTLNLLHTPFTFSPLITPQTIKQTLVNSLNQLPTSLASQIASSSCTCSRCDFSGQIPVISASKNCKCGGILLGKLPDLRVLGVENLNEIHFDGYEIGAILLGKGSVILASGSGFDLFGGEVRELCREESELFEMLADRLFQSVYGVVQYVCYYKMQIFDEPKLSKNSVRKVYEVVPESVPVASVTQKSVQERIQAENVDTTILHSEEVRDEVFIENLRDVTLCGKFESQISMDFNVPSFLIFLFLSLFIFAQFVHIVVLFTQIGNQKLLIVNDLLVEGSMIVRNEQYQNAADFHSQIPPTLTLLTDSVAVDLLNTNQVNCNVEFSTSNFNVNSKTLDKIKTSFLVAENGNFNTLNINSTQFGTSSGTNLQLTNAVFNQPTSFQQAQIGTLTTKNFTFTGNCEIHQQIENLNTNDIIISILNSQNLTSRNLVTPNLQTANLMLSNQLSLPSITLNEISQNSGSFKVQNLSLQNELTINSATQINANFTINGPSSFNNILSINSSFSTGKINSLNAQNLNGQLSISNDVNIDSLDVNNLNCTTIEVAGSNLVQNGVVQLTVVLVETNVVTVNTNSSVITAGRIVQK